MPNKEDDQYFVIGVEDGYFDKISDKETKEYIKAKQRLKEGYYNIIKTGDKFIYKDYIIEVININNFREPKMKYAIDIFDKQGQGLFKDLCFVGEDFFLKCEREVDYKNAE